VGQFRLIESEDFDMDLVNETKLVAGYTIATDKAGRESLVVVAKGTYGIPDQPHRATELLAEQMPLVTTDIFTGEPGFSASKYEIDFAPRKPRCDVLLNGSCYAPGGRPASSVEVTMKVGSLTKSFRVVGHRTYHAGFLSYTVGMSKPFVVMPLSYNNAYGGVDRTNEDPAKHQWYSLNHVGVGFHPKARDKELDGKLLPNTEELSDPVKKPNGRYKPMAFGPIGRAWQQRIRWAGTYDQKWQDDTFPFLPLDFDERYFQCAPESQQMDYLTGGEDVVLINLTPGGRTIFKLPALRESVDFFFKNCRKRRMLGVVDTLILEPDLGRFTLSLRVSLPLRRNLHEVSSVVLGQVLVQEPVRERGEEWDLLGKPHYKSLAHLVAANRTRRQE
jgi:hypothetical protein